MAPGAIAPPRPPGHGPSRRSWQAVAAMSVPEAPPATADPASDGPERGATDLEDAPARRPLPFALAVVPAAIVALSTRLTYAIGWRFDAGLQYDGPIYVARAAFLRRGLGFIDPDSWNFHQQVEQGAVHPPGNALLLALGQQLGFRSTHQAQVLGCLVGTITVVLIAFLGREVAGRRVGLVAAWIASLWPGLWSYDATAMAETPGQLAVAATLLCAYRFWRAPSPRRAAWLGLAAGLGALTRSELTIVIVILVLPLCFVAPGTNRQALSRVGAAMLWTVAAIGPWVGWNLVRFEHPVTMASGIDLSMAYAQCDDTWYGDHTGYWNLFCANNITNAAPNATADESELGAQYRRQAGRYIGDHKGRWPVVIAARVGRTLSLYPPRSQVAVEHDRESRERAVLWAATVATWAAYLLAIVAFVRPPRSRKHLLPLLAPLVAGAAGAALTFGTSRYRSAGEVGLVVLAAVGVDAIVRTWNASAFPQPTLVPERSSGEGDQARDGAFP